MNLSDIQKVIDVFSPFGGWTSKLPIEGVVSGEADLFRDERIRWFLDRVNLCHRNVLELGPLECGHTYMLAQAGAASIWAVEQNPVAYLKGLVVHELLKGEFKFDDPETGWMNLICGDFFDFLADFPWPLRVVVASGVLYHQRQPAHLIAAIAKKCKETLFVWTHYYDADHPRAGEFTPVACGFCDFTYTGYELPYKTEHHIGGPEATAVWMSRPGLFACLEHFGFQITETNFDEPNHPNGPAIALIARRIS